MTVPNAAAVSHGPRGGRSDDKVISAQVRAAGSSFYWAMRLQPREKRAGLFAVYAFCREVDLSLIHISEPTRPD